MIKQLVCKTKTGGREDNDESWLTNNSQHKTLEVQKIIKQKWDRRTKKKMIKRGFRLQLRSISSEADLLYRRWPFEYQDMHTHMLRHCNRLKVNICIKKQIYRTMVSKLIAYKKNPTQKAQQKKRNKMVNLFQNSLKIEKWKNPKLAHLSKSVLRRRREKADLPAPQTTTMGGGAS